jgi:hypothetical protein
MNSIKGYALFLVSLLVAIIVIRFVLKQGKKLPAVGGALGKADELAFD